MAYVFDPAPVVSLPVRGIDAMFPVHRIYCVGRNYAKHAIEMGHDPDKDPPFFFQKNPDNLVLEPETLPYPSRTQNLHHEMEMVIALGKGGSDISVDQALDHVYGYGAAIDFTRRDLQEEAKKLSRPWEVGKAFEDSAPAGPLTRASEIGHPDNGSIWLDVNGERRQTGDLNQMIWKTPEIIAHLSGLFMLAPGDLILSGTPDGVGPVVRGDRVHCGIDGLGELDFKII